MTTQNTKPGKIFDYVMIGGGLTGCYLLHQIVSKDKTAHCLLLEAGTELGGRISTIDFKDTDGEHIHYEAGGARFSDKHIRLNRLLKKFELSTDKVAIANTVEHVMVPAVPFTLNSKPTPGEREFLGTPVPLAWDCNPMPTVILFL